MPEVRKGIVIAIDGYSSCGKSTLARQLAHHYQYSYIDTGAMYRAVTLYALNMGLNQSNFKEIEKYLEEIHIDLKYDDDIGKQITFLNGDDVESQIRQPNINSVVSYISEFHQVRLQMVDQQRRMGGKGSVIMDGRDIGTVVFPNADLKLFMTANVEIRTQRRQQELASQNVVMDFEEIKKNLLHRDHIDSTRLDSPLMQATDAIVIDNSDINMDEQLQLAINLVNDRLPADAHKS
ncbi:MAG: (d)CMP kinase [Bacteroidota bacterium]|nr:(d)CMP kinase [Bacteroidota bacterium]